MRRHLASFTWLLSLAACAADPAEPAPDPATLDGCLADGSLSEVESFDNNHGAVVAFALASTRQAAFAAEDGSIKLWTLGAAAGIEAGAGESLYDTAWAQGGPVSRALGWAGDGGTLASGDDLGRVALWDRAGRELASVSIGELAPTAVAVAPDGRVAIAEAGFGGPIRIWDPTTGALGEPLATQLWGVSVLAFLPDGTLLSAGDIYGDPAVERREAADLGTVVAGYEGVSARVVALAVDDQRIFAAGPGVVAVLDRASLSIRAEAHPPEHQPVAVGLSASYAVTVAEGGDARVYDVDDASEVARLALPSTVGLAVDGERLLTAGIDGQVRRLGCAP